MKDVVRKMLQIIGTILLTYGLIVLMIIGVGGLFNWFFVAGGVCLLGLSLIWPKINRNIKRILLVLMTMILAIFIVIETMIVSYSIKKCDDDADYVIVLGSQIRTDGPSNDYKARLDSAYEYLIDNDMSMVICTGGQGINEPISEAKGGADYLIKKGLYEDRIIIEDKSLNTLQNLENAKLLIEDRNDDVSEVKVVIVSADYHLYRASYLAKRLGYGNVSCKGGHGLLILLPQYYTREFFALIKEWLIVK